MDELSGKQISMTAITWPVARFTFASLRQRPLLAMSMAMEDRCVSMNYAASTQTGWRGARVPGTGAL
jgi:hypothetical protein